MMMLLLERVVLSLEKVLQTRGSKRGGVDYEKNIHSTG